MTVVPGLAAAAEAVSAETGVDLNWARAHHDRWADECIENGQVVSASDYPDSAMPAASKSA